MGHLGLCEYRMRTLSFEHVIVELIHDSHVSETLIVPTKLRRIARNLFSILLIPLPPPMKGVPLLILLFWELCNAVVISDPSDLKRDSPLK